MDADDCGQGCPLIPSMVDSKDDNVDNNGKANLTTTLAQAFNLIQSQNEALSDLRNQANGYRVANATLQDRIDSLTKDLDALRVDYHDDLAKQKSELKLLADQHEVFRECSAQANDELRFQILGIRSKLDPSKHGVVSPEVLRASVSQSNGHHSESGQRGDQTTNRRDSMPVVAAPLRTPMNHNAEIVWRIGGFSRKLKKIKSGASEDPFLSDAFTTGPYGYRMSIWAYLNGRGKGVESHVSLYARINVGEFDPILKWPIRPRYTFTLIDQVANPMKRNNHVRVRDLTLKQSGVDRPKKDEKSVIVGFDDFISHDDLKKHNFLIEDSLFVRVVADIHE